MSNHECDDPTLCPDCNDTAYVAAVDPRLYDRLVQRHTQDSTTDWAAVDRKCAVSAKFLRQGHKSLSKGAKPPATKWQFSLKDLFWILVLFSLGLQIVIERNTRHVKDLLMQAQLTILERELKEIKHAREAVAGLRRESGK